MKVTVYSSAPDGTPQVDIFDYPKVIFYLDSLGMATVECRAEKAEAVKFWTTNRAWKIVRE